jgi:hypothetical protein
MPLLYGVLPKFFKVYLFDKNELQASKNDKNARGEPVVFFLEYL